MGVRLGVSWTVGEVVGLLVGVGVFVGSGVFVGPGVLVGQGVALAAAWGCWGMAVSLGRAAMVAGAAGVTTTTTVSTTTTVGAADGRLQAKGLTASLHCERCGQSINSGRFCESCINEVNAEIQGHLPQKAKSEEPKRPPRGRVKDKMHIKDKGFL